MNEVYGERGSSGGERGRREGLFQSARRAVEQQCHSRSLARAQEDHNDSLLPTREGGSMEEEMGDFEDYIWDEWEEEESTSSKGTGVTQSTRGPGCSSRPPFTERSCGTTTSRCSLSSSMLQPPTGLSGNPTIPPPTAVNTPPPPSRPRTTPPPDVVSRLRPPLPATKLLPPGPRTVPMPPPTVSGTTPPPTVLSRAGTGGLVASRPAALPPHTKTHSSSSSFFTAGPVE